MSRKTPVEQIVSGLRLSIVIPVFNRAKLVHRAIQSCLESTRPDFEVIVVDDCSIDNTLDVISNIQDHRLKVHRLPFNQGVCAARGAGVRACASSWVCFLDSDDEIIAGSIDEIIAVLESQNDSIQAVMFRRAHDDGRITPTVITQYGPIDYDGYIRLIDPNFSDDSGVFYSARKTTFDLLPWPTARTPEIEYHLDFAKRFQLAIHPCAPYLEHHDATNRLTKPRSGSTHVTNLDRETMMSYRRIITAHGDALSAGGKNILRRVLTGRLTLELISGNRSEATDTLTRSFRMGDRSLRKLVLFAVGFVSPRALLALRSYWQRVRHHTA
jgi:glycosyltransferase involved in cell wall biosynthesis